MGPNNKFSGTKYEDPSTKTVVSDALAKNSRQLLYAHLYNYLIENGHTETAKVLLNEADVPVSNFLDKDHLDKNSTSNQFIEAEDDLPGVKMLMTSPDTFLLEWWQSLWSLHSYVKDTASLQQQYQQFPMKTDVSKDLSKFANSPSSNLNFAAPNRSMSIAPPVEELSSPAISVPSSQPKSQPSSAPHPQQQPGNHSNSQTPLSGVNSQSPAVVPTSYIQQHQSAPVSQLNHHNPMMNQQQLKAQQQQQQQQQWQYNKIQQLQAQELQQRVQLQKAQLDNQYNLQNMTPQQQQQRLQMQQNMQAAQQAGIMNDVNPNMNGCMIPPGMPQQQFLGQSQQLNMSQNDSSFQPQGSSAPTPQSSANYKGANKKAGKSDTPEESDKNPNSSQQSQPQYNIIDPNGLRVDNSTALQDYQLQLMLLENQNQAKTGPQLSLQGTTTNNNHNNNNHNTNNGGNNNNLTINSNSKNVLKVHSPNGAGKSRGSSIAVDPLQPDPLMNNAQFMELFPNDASTLNIPSGNFLGNPSMGTGGSIGNWNSQLDPQLNVGGNGVVDESEFVLNGGNLNLMNGF